MSDLLDRLSSVASHEHVQLILDSLDFLGDDLDVGGLSASGSARGLVDHDAGVGQRTTLAGGTGGQQEGSHRGGLTHTDRGDIGAHVPHGVVDRHARSDAAAGAVDVEVDVLVRILAVQEEELRDDGIGDIIVDGCAQEDDAIQQQAGVDVVGTLTAVCLLNDGGDDKSRHESSLQVGYPGSPGKVM